MDLPCCVHITDCEDFAVELLRLPPESAASVIHLDNPDFCASFYHNQTLLQDTCEALLYENAMKRQKAGGGEDSNSFLDLF